MRVAFLSLALCGALLAQDKGQDKKMSIASVGWLAGSWEGPMQGGTFEEHWTKPSGGTMVGMGRLVMKDRTAMVEFLKIVEDGGRLVMSVTLDTQPEVKFTCTKAEKDECVWENPKHDYPTKISYRKEKDGGLTARIEGDGGANPMDFKLKPAGK